MWATNSLRHEPKFMPQVSTAMLAPSLNKLPAIPHFLLFNATMKFWGSPLAYMKAHGSAYSACRPANRCVVKALVL